MSKKSKINVVAGELSDEDRAQLERASLRSAPR